MHCNCDSSSSCDDCKFLKETADRRLTECIDDVISEYLSVGDPESCCEKLEKILTQGLNEQLEGIEGKADAKFMLHPLHHLSLEAYTTLASAYRELANLCYPLAEVLEGVCALILVGLFQTSLL